VGHILATGNVGSYLNQREANTYLSIDGGRHWREVAIGSHIYEISDHGNIILMALDQKATNEVLFSLDDGATFQNYIFSETSYEIFNILEVFNTKFILYGRDEFNRGIAIGLDLTKVFDRICDTNSDYENWEFPPEGCILGQRFTFHRKKTDKICLNGEKFDKLKHLSFCECTEEDWECDVGY